MIIGEKSPLVKRNERRITQSALNLLCKRRFHYSVNERLDPKYERGYLKLGQLWHNVMAAHWGAIATAQPEPFVHGLHVHDIISAEPSDLIDAWYESMRIAERGPDQEDAGEQADLVRGMYRTYCEAFPHHRDQQEWRVLAIEHQIEKPIPRPDEELLDRMGDRWRIPQWTVVGTLDLVLQHRIHKHVVVGDHKTTKTDRRKFFPNLALAFQPWDYTALATLEFQCPVRTIFYGASRKKLPTEPHILKRASDGVASGMPSKAYCDSTVERYRGALKRAGVEDWDPYLENLARLHRSEDENGNSFHWRTFATITKAHQDLFWLNVHMRCVELEHEIDWAQNFGACELFSGCAFRPLCAEGDDAISRMLYVQRPEGRWLSSVKGDPTEED